MRYFSISLICIFWFNNSYSQVSVKDSEQRQINIYEYQSKIFSGLEKIFLDSLYSRFSCERLDLASVIIESNENCFRFNLSPRTGRIFTMFEDSDFGKKKHLWALKLKNSNLIYLFQESDIEHFRDIGNLTYLEQRPLLPFIIKLDNYCLHQGNTEYSEINAIFNVDYCFENGFKVNPVLYYLIER